MVNFPELLKHRFYDALQYPSIFLKRGLLWNYFDYFYAFHIMYGQNDFNLLLRCLQFLVDMYVKIEGERLR